MKGFKSTSANPYTYTQDGVWKRGQYTFQAIVKSDSGYAIAFQKPDLSWDVIDLSWQVQAGQYCSVLEAGFTLEYDAVAFKLIANDVTGEVVVLSPMLEQGANPSTPIAHEEDLRGMDGDFHEFIFTRNDTGIAPDAPLSTQEDDLEPEGWTDNPQGVTKELPFEFVSMREKKVGVWLDYSQPSLWAKWSEDGLSVYLLKQGHYESRWVGTEKVTDIVGGEMFGETELIKVTAVFHKGEEDVAPTESLSRGFQWYVNGVHLPAFDDQHYITLDSTYGDGFADIVKLSYIVNSLREEVEVEVMNISAGMDGIGEEFIFKANNSGTEPPVLPQTTDTNYQDDDYYGQGTANVWSDEPVAPTELNQYVWVAKRKKVGGVWEAFGTPSIWTKWVEDGEPGEDAKMIEIRGNTTLKNPDKPGGIASTELTVVKHGFDNTVMWKFLYGSTWQYTPWTDNITINYNEQASLFTNGVLQLKCYSALDPTIFTTVTLSAVWDGDDGDGNVHIYRHSLLKPATPASGVADPTGWTKNPDKGIAISIPTNWTLKDKWYQSEELTTSGTTTISVINFTTTLPNQVVVLELWADGHATYDYIYAGNLNIGVTTSNYYDRVIGGKKVISYDVPNAGSHSIQIMWRKGISTIAGSNRGYFAIIENVKVWRSTTAVINKIYQLWSSPEEFYPDSSTEETIYCLSKTETPPLISDSDAYVDEYIPLPCALASYRGDFSTNRSYAIAEVVVYSGEYYKVIKYVSSNYSGNPTNTEYFERIKGWTDNAQGATAEFPFEYRSKRKKSGGAWGAFSASTVDGRWVEDGEDGDGIVSTTIEYAKSESGTTTPTTWSTSLPTPTKGMYLWTRTTTVYKKSPTTVAYSISYWSEDGDDAVDIRLTATNTQAVIGTNGVTPIQIKVTGTAKNTTISGWSYSVDGGSFTTPPNGVTRAGNVVTIITAVAVWRTLAIKAYNTTDDVDAVITISIVGYGAAGEKGKVPIVKEWLNADTHLNNANVVDYIYYRPTRTWWKLKDEYTSRVATSPPSTTYYEQIPYMGALAAKVLIAEEANLANFVFKDGKLLSIAGTVNGSPATYTGQAGFVHNIILDGLTGKIYAQNAEITGTVNATSGVFTGALASPFERTKSTYTKDFSNNLIVTGSAFTLPWDQLGSGRLIRLIQPNPGTSYCTAPTGKYFYEDGEQKNTLTMLGAEIVELLGYTDSQGNFTGWLVLNRGLLHTVSTWGEPHRIVAHGRVKTNDPFKYHTFDGSALSTSTGGSSSRRYTLIAMPTTWFDSTDGYYVKIIANGGDSAAFHTVEKNTNYAFAVYQHSLNVANGTLSPTTTFDFYFEIYSAAWLYPKSGGGGVMPGVDW